jgi:hypothetical protein
LTFGKDSLYKQTFVTVNIIFYLESKLEASSLCTRWNCSTEERQRSKNAAMEAGDRARAGVAATEIEKHELVPGDMESDPMEARELELVPTWREQLTLRGMVTALLVGFIFTVIVMKIALTTGLVPTLNVSAALLVFLALRGWTRLLERLGFAHRPFTRQENCVVETCAVACYTIAFGGQYTRTPRCSS